MMLMQSATLRITFPPNHPSKLKCCIKFTRRKFCSLLFYNRMETLDIGIQNNISFSFTRSIRVLAKIESLESLQKLGEIVEASDGIMIARGDLGVEIPLEQIPTVQEEITYVCRQMNKPVIVASQLLESMVEFPTPTRAEVLFARNEFLLYRQASYIHRVIDLMLGS